MFLDARNGTIKIENTDMDYISFGSGRRILVMIPGLGDGLRTVKGTAGAMAMLYKEFAEKYKVFVFSRKNKLEENTSIRDMAKTQRDAMRTLGIRRASVVGISQGGMIAQHLAIDYPEMVEKLVLAVTMARQNEITTRVIGRWMKMAAENDYKGVFIDTMEKSYTEQRRHKNRRLYPLLTRIAKPQSLDRYIIQANAILRHNSYDELKKIKCPTLVIGASEDKVVDVQASRDIAAQIPGSKLKIYAGLGHGVYEESKDFNRQVLEFLSV